jgi:hypothetical protein
MSNNPSVTRFKKPAKRKYSLRERALFLSRTGAAIGDRLSAIAIHAADSAEYERDRLSKIISKSDALTADMEDAAAALIAADHAFVLGQKIVDCSTNKNQYLGYDLNTKDGECFDGRGALARCRSRFCAGCAAYLGKENRRTADFVVGELNKKRLVNERWRFTVFTLPKIDGRSLLFCEIILFRVWWLFIRRDVYKKMSRAGLRGNEFTFTTSDRYHFHINYLALGFLKDNLEKDIKLSWSDCARIVFEEFGLPYSPCDTTGTLNVHIKLVVEGGERVTDSEKQITRSGSITELLKYCTKGNTWTDVPDADLLEAAGVRRTRRNFALTGDAALVMRDRNKLVESYKEASAEARDEWIKHETAVRAENEFETERENFYANKDLCSYDAANVWETSEPVDFDDCTTTNPLLAAVEPVKMKRLNWREEVTRDGPADYLVRYRVKLKRAQEWRQRQMGRLYPLSSFFDLDGDCWYAPKGVDAARKAEIFESFDALISSEEARSQAAARGDQAEYNDLYCEQAAAAARVARSFEALDADSGLSSEQIAEFEAKVAPGWVGANLNTFFNAQRSGGGGQFHSQTAMAAGDAGKGRWQSDDSYRISRDARVETDQQQPAVAPQKTAASADVSWYRLFDVRTGDYVKLKDVDFPGHTARGIRFTASEAASANQSFARNRRAYFEWINVVDDPNPDPNNGIPF